MPDRDEPQSERENRVGEAVAWYYRAAEAGSPPNPVDFLARFPDLRPELVSFLADKDAFHRAAGPPADVQPDPDVTLPPSPNPNFNTVAYAPSGEPTATLPPPGSESAVDAPLGLVRYFGDYELLAEIARGGMGVVFKARQVSLNRLVALKMILAGQFASEADVTRFHIEAEAAAHLDHPNIVPIHEIGVHEGNHYYAMQFVDGPSLASQLGSTTYSSREAAELIRLCASAVQYAHDRGVIHRDLKPGNILLQGAGDQHTPDSPSLAPYPSPLTPVPKITDFGLAKRIGNTVPLTGTGQIVGTPSYMAPEQASSKKEVGPAVDVYALGAILYELLTGQPPFRAATPLDTVLQVVSEEPIPPSHRQEKVPADLETICLKCLEKQPDQRYASAGALADDLGRFLNHEPILARPASRTRRVGVWVRKRPWVMVGLALVAILAVSLVAQSFYLENRRQGQENLYREAQINRLSLAQQTAPEIGTKESLRPAAKQALQFLHQAAKYRPQGRLYDEALDLMLVEHRGGKRIYPKPGAKAELPRAWSHDDQEFPWPFTLTKDAMLLQVPRTLFNLDTGTLTRYEGPTALQTWCDPTGTLLARRFKPSGLEVVERANGALRLRIDPEAPLGVWTTRFSNDGRLLAVVIGERGMYFSDWNSRANERWRTRSLEIWDVTAGRLLKRISLPDGAWPTRPEFSGDSRFVAWATPEEVLVYAATTGELINRIAAPGAEGAALSPDGTMLAWSRGFSGRTEDMKVTVVRVSDSERLHELRTTGPVAVVRVAYTSDGRFVIGQTGFRERDPVYMSFGRMDPKRAIVFQDQTDRICIWDAMDGKLLASLRGRAFADGFGPHGELAVARSIGTRPDTELEIDLWRPSELVDALDNEGLLSWVYFLDQDSKDDALSIWVFGLFFVAILIPTFWMGNTVQRVQEKRITVRTAHTGIILTLLLIVGGVSFFMAAVTQLSGHWVDAFQLDSDHAFGLLYAVLGLIYLLIASLTGGLAIQCYSYATYGETAAFFERLQALPVVSETERKLQEERARRIIKISLCGLLGFGIVFVVVAYLDRSFHFIILTSFGPIGLFILLGSAFLYLSVSLVLSMSLRLILALVEAKWGPPKQPWFILPTNFPQNWFNHFVARVCNLFPLRKASLFAFWLVILLTSLGLAAFELHTRLTSGNWPRSSNDHFGDGDSTGRLALAVFYVPVSLLCLVRMARSRQ
ncbi:MAG TPA: protein kinase [Gemmata sp.]|jgi:serine/threonine protein kinase|nr:protein kinase [Gemmata sp.]